MDTLAVYPLRQPSSRTTNLVLIGVAALVGIALVGRQLFGGEADLRWLYIGLMVLFAGFPAAYWVATSGPQLGGGEIELSAGVLRIPTVGNERIDLSLDNLELQMTTSSVGLGYGPIPLGPGIETGRRLRLTSNGQSVDLDRDYSSTRTISVS